MPKNRRRAVYEARLWREKQRRKGLRLEAKRIAAAQARMTPDEAQEVREILTRAGRPSLWRVWWVWIVGTIKGGVSRWLPRRQIAASDSDPA